MRFRSLLLLFVLLFPASLFATDIIGNTMMYTQINDSTYEITVRLYRNCNVGSGNYPPSVFVNVRDVNGNTFTPSKNFTITFDSLVPVQSYLNACMVNPGICTDEGYYTQTVNNLHPIPGGYHLYYQYCCRNAAVSNITNALNAGFTAYTFIPGTALTSSHNSSPHWLNAPPLFECQNNPMNYSAAATDADGDSLVYSYYTPADDNSPTFPSGIATFIPLTWAFGYSATNPCGGPALTMNSQTGMISGTPQTIGTFVAGIRCEEYRNGVKIGEILRDYPFYIVSCPQMPVASGNAPSVTCLGNTIQFQNTSVAATNYYWDFGDSAITNDTSSAQNPSWLYAQSGIYNITLIAEPNTNCADTTVFQITVEEVIADWYFTGTASAGQPVNFFDSSYTSSGSQIVIWSWDFGDNTTNSTSQNPMHTYVNSGTYFVTLFVVSANGCQSVIVDTIAVDLFNGITNFGFSSVQVMPNPGDGHFMLLLPCASASGIIFISDMNGNIIRKEEVPFKKQVELFLDVPPGIYLIEYQNEDKKYFQKIQIDR